MTAQGQLFDRFAICSARLAANNYITITKHELENTEVDKGDEVRVMLLKPDSENSIKGVDRDIYDTTVQKSGQFYVPKDTRQKLDLSTGDVVRYIVVPKKSFPGIAGGPVRNKMKELASGDTDEESENEQRDNREKFSAEFSDSPMQQTGQITIPSNIMEEMALLQGDTVLTAIRWEGDGISRNKTIGTGNRITVSVEEREELGLTKGDEPTIRISVLD